jgi:hypothetical protein
MRRARCTTIARRPFLGQNERLVRRALTLFQTPVPWRGRSTCGAQKACLARWFPGRRRLRLGAVRRPARAGPPEHSEPRRLVLVPVRVNPRAFADGPRRLHYSGATCSAGQACTNGACVGTGSTTGCIDHVANGTSATLQCPSGYTIQAIPFAGYGQPTGACSSGPFADASCDAANVAQSVRQSCAGLNTCTIAIQQSAFSNNMSCTGSIWFTAQYTCSPTGVTVCP